MVLKSEPDHISVHRLAVASNRCRLSSSFSKQAANILEDTNNAAIMAFRRFILLYVALSYAFGTGAHAFSVQHTPNDQTDSAIGKILENTQYFNATNLLASFGLPQCLQDCIEEMGDIVKDFDVKGNWTVENTKTVCSKFDAVKSCLSAKSPCDSFVIQIPLHASELICSDNNETTELLPCIRKELLQLQTTCERSCKFGSTLLQFANLNAKNTDTVNLVDADGKKILSVPDIHVLCNTSTCFLSCMRTNLEAKCPNGGSVFLDNMLTSFAKETKMVEPLPGRKSVDPYSALLAAVLPQHCRHLVLKNETTPIFAANPAPDAGVEGRSEAGKNGDERSFKGAAATDSVESKEDGKGSNSGSIAKLSLVTFAALMLLMLLRG